MTEVLRQADETIAAVTSGDGLEGTIRHVGHVEACQPADTVDLSSIHANDEEENLERDCSTPGSLSSSGSSKKLTTQPLEQTTDSVSYQRPEYG